MKYAWTYKQVGVLPFRINEDQIEVLLITTRKNKRWIIPKGLCDNIDNPIKSARHEALEEAGIKGKIYENPSAKYKNVKWDGAAVIEVFLMKVKKSKNTFEENDFRERKWFTIPEAIEIVDIPALKKLISQSTPIIKRLLKWEEMYGE